MKTEPSLWTPQCTATETKSLHHLRHVHIFCQCVSPIDVHSSFLISLFDIVNLADHPAFTRNDHFVNRFRSVHHVHLSPSSCKHPPSRSKHLVRHLRPSLPPLSKPLQALNNLVQSKFEVLKDPYQFDLVPQHDNRTKLFLTFQNILPRAARP